MSSELDGVLGEIAAAAGETAALLIAKAHGGTEIYVPERLPRPHPLRDLIGDAAAEALARAMGPRRLTVPFGSLAAKHRALSRMDLTADSARTIARAVGMTERTVFRHRARRRNDDDPDLFG